MGVERPDARPLAGQGRRIGIVVARFNGTITEALLSGALARLAEAGVADADIEIHRVPGAWEIPFAVKRLLAKTRCDAVIALAAVIRGGTPHFDYVCRGVADGCMRAGLDDGRPIGFGVLTCDDEAQAMARSGDDEHNKGREAAAAVLETLSALAAIG